MKENTNKEHKTTPIENCGIVMEEVQVIFFKAVKPLITQYFDTIDKALLQLCEQSSTEKKTTFYHNALESIRVYKLNVLSSFLKSLKQTFTLFKAQNFNYFEDKVTKVVKKNHKAPDSIDKDDVMEKMAQNNLIQASEKNHQASLNLMQEQFSMVLSQSINLYQVPASPYVVVSAFAKSIRLLHLDVKIKLVLYKHFEHHVMNKLCTTYRQINTYLTSSLNHHRTGQDNGSVEQKYNDQRTHNQNFILNLLITLQQQALRAFSKNNIWPHTPEQALKKLIKRIEQSQRPVEKCDIETLKLATMMFQMIVDNINIPNAITSNLTTMHIAYMRAAILDDSLLNDKSHPAQRLLDLLSNKSLGWNIEADQDDSFINKVKYIADKVLHKNEPTAKHFRIWLDDFQVYVESNPNAFAHEQQKIKNKTMGREKIISSMKTVEALLTHKLDGVIIPNEIKNTLLGPWKNVLALLLVRESSTSKKYLYMVDFIDEAIKILTPNNIELVMQKNISKLCEHYAEGLTLVAYSGDELQKKTQELYLCLLNIHDLKDRRKDMDFISDKSTLGPIKSTERLHDAVKHIDYSNHIPDLSNLNVRDQKNLSTIKVGMWLSFLDEDNESFEAKLSWISPRSGKYLFVNSKGLKTLDKTPKQLVSGLNKKTISICKKSS